MRNDLKEGATTFLTPFINWASLHGPSVLYAGALLTVGVGVGFAARSWLTHAPTPTPVAAKNVPAVDPSSATVRENLQEINTRLSTIETTLETLSSQTENLEENLLGVALETARQSEALKELVFDQTPVVAASLFGHLIKQVQAQNYKMHERVAAVQRAVNAPADSNFPAADVSKILKDFEQFVAGERKRRMTSLKSWAEEVPSDKMVVLPIILFSGVAFLVRFFWGGGSTPEPFFKTLTIEKVLKGLLFLVVSLSVRALFFSVGAPLEVQYLFVPVTVVLILYYFPKFFLFLWGRKAPKIFFF